jgi:hypothetical protein
MPNSADAGVVDFILSPDKMTEKLLEVTQIIIPTSIDQNLPLGDEEVFRQINAVLVSVKELISLITNKPLFAEEFFVEWPLTK